MFDPKASGMDTGRKGEPEGGALRPWEGWQRAGLTVMTCPGYFWL